MKILFTSDWHIDAATAGVERCAELWDYILTLEADIIRDGIDLVCFCGDAFDPGSLRECRWSKMVVEAALRLTKVTTYGVIFIPGNHDVIDTTIPFSTLSPLVAMAEHSGAAKLRVFELPRATTFVGEGHSPVVVLALPYVSGACARGPVYNLALDMAFTSAEASRKKIGAAIVVIGHYTIQGIRPGSEGEMLRGRDMPLPIDRLKALQPELIVNGHYHSRQTAKVDGLVIEIVGSPAQYKFGEPDGTYGYLIAEF